MSGFPVTGYKLMVISCGRSFPDGVSSFITSYSSGNALISQVIFNALCVVLKNREPLPILVPILTLQDRLRAFWALCRRSYSALGYAAD